MREWMGRLGYGTWNVYKTGMVSHDATMQTQVARKIGDAEKEAQSLLNVERCVKWIGELEKGGSGRVRDQDRAGRGDSELSKMSNGAHRNPGEPHEPAGRARRALSSPSSLRGRQIPPGCG